MKNKFPIIISCLLLAACSESSTNSDISTSFFNEENSSIVSNSETSSLESSYEESKSEISSETSSESSLTSSSTSSSSSSSSSESEPEKPINRLDPFSETKFNEQVYLHHVGNVFEAWKQYRGKGVKLAVIDVGFEYNHAEFKNSDGTSRVSNDSAYFETKNGTTSVKVGKENVSVGEESHGTFCAGVAAGSVTGTGIVGIAPEAELLLLKVDLKPKSICKAIEYATDNGARVITISVGSYANYVGDLKDDGSDLSTIFNASMKYAHDNNVVICSAAGNGGEMGIPTQYTYPGASDYVIGVGGLAFNSSDNLWSGSSYNSSASYQFIDIVAPGENMTGACNYGGKTYDSGWNGTSFSSPIVAGAACLYFEKNPNATNVDFERDLYATAVKISDTKHVGAGRLDIGALLDIETESTVTINFEGASWWDSDGAQTSVYLWNSVTGKQSKEWPGTLMNNKSYTVSLSDYDSVIFTRTSSTGVYWNAKTLDLSLYAFLSRNTYSISQSTATWDSDNGPVLTGNFK